MPQTVREALGRILSAAAMLWAGEAAAFMIVPVEEAPDRIVVEIERSYGDRVPLKALPPPYNDIVQILQGPERLSFRWEHFRSGEQGLFFIHVDEDGAARARFEFAGRALADGDTLGAAAVLLDAAGAPLHALMARADVTDGVFAGGGPLHRVPMEFVRTPEWWRSVDSVLFLNMKYYRQQKPSDAGVWLAMERAVRRAAGALGSLQRGDGGVSAELPGRL